MPLTPKEEESTPAAPLPRERRVLVVVDVVESVRLMLAHEDDVIDRWRRFVNAVRTEVLPVHDGRMVKSLGDGMLLEFLTVSQAMAASRSLCARLVEFNVHRAEDAQIRIRLGAHAADIVVDELDIFGSGVNLAARLAAIAKPNQMAISAEVRDQLVVGLDGAVEDLGDCYFKHVSEPVRAYRMATSDTAVEVPVPSNQVLETSVAVMPLRPRRVTAADHAAGHLICDEIVASLSRSPYLTVISSLSTAALVDRPMAVQQMGLWLGATYIVSGAFDCDGDSLSVHVEMTHAPSGAVLWIQRWAASLRDLLAGQDDLVSLAVSAISHTIMQRELQRSSHAPLPSLESHSLLMSGIGLIHRSSARDFERAKDLLEMLADRHARLPHANAWLGKWYVLRSVQGLTSDPQMDGRRALACANRALDVDPNSALALAMHGHVQGFLLHDLAAADRSLEEALRVNPNEPLAWIYQAVLRAWQSRAAEGLPIARRARILSPLDPMRYYYDTLLAFVAMTAGEHALAAEFAERSMKSNRLHLSSHRTLAISQWHLGQLSAAHATVDEMMRIDPGFTVARYRARYPGGDGEQARANGEVLRACGAPD
jgi:class 3 adenylate cyclase/TolB-like protein/tetratricopeptide (TPR) repeat protein